MKHLILLSLIALATLSCSTKSPDNSGASFLDDCEVVAAKEVVDGDTVIVCDFNKVKQRKNVPLDELLTDFTVLKMDNENEEGLIGRQLTGHIIGKKYIAVFSYSFMPLKLYDKQGKFIRNIGKIGQGPGEYGVINNVYMDEKADRIYILAFDTDKVLVYDFEGNILDPISLAERVQYGNSIIVNTEKKELIVTKSPRRGATNAVWIQDFEGNIIQAVKQSDYFSDEISTSESSITRLQTPNIEFFSLNGYNNNQYLYHYDVKGNKLVPKFRMKNMDEYWIFVYELPHHFVVEVATSTSDGKDDYSTPKLIVDKYTLKGCFFDGFLTPMGVVLDQYDILFNARYGYFGLVDFGSYIDEKIQKVDKESLSSKGKKELEKLQQLIDETDLDDDCSLLFYGKFKQ
ncbi:MAG TPA: hypothetical protein DDZ57_04265 [Porphyromonadaceae bacterium]|jgi:hypothetical protein|nr:hypothetical protein [Porphyromonadaceae bacterium]HBK40770.1 hypothetical protein [Porphyromonadaceae bacterium]